jgi:hypothetical protein
MRGESARVVLKCRVGAGQRFPRTRPAKNLLVIRDEKVAAKYEENRQMHFDHSEYYAGK